MSKIFKTEAGATFTINGVTYTADAEGHVSVPNDLAHRLRPFGLKELEERVDGAADGSGVFDISAALRELRAGLVRVKGHLELDLQKNDAYGDDIVLVGSGAFPSDFTLENGQVLSLGDVVRTAYERTGVSAKDWNALSQEDRDLLIQIIVDGFALAPAKPVSNAA